MMCKIRANRLGSFAPLTRINSVANQRLFNTLSNRVVRITTEKPKLSKKERIAIGNDTRPNNTFEYTIPLEPEVNYMQHRDDYVDEVIFNKMKAILDRHTSPDVEKIKKMILNMLDDHTIRKEILDGTNAKIVAEVKKLTGSNTFTIHYPNHQQVALLQLFTDKLLEILSVMFKDVNYYENHSKEFIRSNEFTAARKIYTVLTTEDSDDYSLIRLFKSYAKMNNQAYIGQTVEEMKYDWKVATLINDPLQWFPKTKLFKRKFVLHVGPTNSGKTYTALNLLKESKGRSFYAGPLRLLAKEIYDKFNYEYKIPCNLLTGEKVINVVDPNTGAYANVSAGTTDYIARTIENQQEYDIVVVDEAQLLNDEFRGGSIMNIIFGCRAKQIHLCGDPRFVPILKRLCALMNDDIEIIEYERRSKLRLADSPMPHMRNLKAGDCLIDASRASILSNKAKIEKMLKVSAATVYGGQPLSIRAFQAHLFNTRQSPILVASNAIGIGMNLNIDQIVFYSMKRGGNFFRGLRPTKGSPPPPPSYFLPADIKQMAGRAGRNKSYGTVTTLLSKTSNYSEKSDYAILTRALEKKNDSIIELFVSPPMRILAKGFELFRKEFQIVNGIAADSVNLERAYHDFLPKVELKQSLLYQRVKILMLKNQKGPTMIYKELTEMDNMAFLEKVSLSYIPLKTNNQLELEFLKKTIKLLNDKKVVTLDNCGINFDAMKRILKPGVVEKYANASESPQLLNTLNLESGQNLQDVESISRCLTALLWLNTRYPNRIVNKDAIDDLLIQCDLIMHYIHEVEPKTYEAPNKKFNDGFKRSSHQPYRRPHRRY